MSTPVATQARFRNDLSDSRHGTYQAYVNMACRCLRCRAANAEYRRGYRTRKAAS